jgi:hypothetical protein
MKTLLLFLTACLLALGVELAQSSADSTKINPNECGLTFKQANRLIRKQKRFLIKDEDDDGGSPSAEKTDQREWGWTVYLAESNTDGRGSTGSLINSRWVLASRVNYE